MDELCVAVGVVGDAVTDTLDRLRDIEPSADVAEVVTQPAASDPGVDVLLTLTQDSLTASLADLALSTSQQHQGETGDHPSLVRTLKRFHAPQSTMQVPVDEHAHD